MAVPGDGPFAGKNSSVVDQDVYVGVVGPYLLGQPAHLAERGEVGPVATELVVVRSLADLAHRGLHALLVSSVQQYRGPGSVQVVGDSSSKSVGSASDQDRRFICVCH